jgi:hypothetical protein
MTNGAFWGGMFLVFLALYLLKHAIKSFHEFEDSKNWPFVIGQIVYSEVVRPSATNSRRDFLVNYDYQVNGKQYRGNRVTLYTIIDEAEAVGFQAKFATGSSVPVYYRTEVPSESILVTGGRGEKKYGEIIMSFLVLVVGVVVSIAGYFGHLNS